MTTHVNDIREPEPSAMRDDGRACDYERTQQWAALVDCDEEARVAHMADRYRTIAEVVPEGERRQQLADIVEQELSWDDATLRTYTASRLRAWAMLGRSDADAVRTVAADVDAIFAVLPGTQEFRRAMTVQALFEGVLPPDEQALLFDLVPGFERYVALKRVLIAPPEPAAPRESTSWWRRLIGGSGAGAGHTRLDADH
jgi:hypothetical protein